LDLSRPPRPPDDRLSNLLPLSLEIPVAAIVSPSFRGRAAVTAATATLKKMDGIILKPVN
jgi:hypothetical protein